MGVNGFSEREDDILESKTFTAEVRVSDDDDDDEHTEGTGIRFVIIKVISGDTAFEGEPFYINDPEFADEDETYLADLEVSWYENNKAPDIECLSIMPLDTEG